MSDFAYFERKFVSFTLPIAIVLVILVGLLDYVTGTELSFSIFYLLPVSIVAWYQSRLITFLVSVLSAIAWFTCDLLGGHSYSTPFIPYWNAGVRFGFFLIVAYLLQNWRKSRDQELGLAKEIQQGLLPKTIPSLSGYDISCISKPSHDVSGDYYDAIKFNETLLGICIADVAGHGIPAAILMSNLQAAFKIFSAAASSPSDLCSKLDAVISSNVTSGNFITFFYGLLDSAKGKFNYTNAGHHPPILVRKDGALMELDKGGLALGFKQEAVYESNEVPLFPGDRLFFFTDGIVEARNSENEEFGVDRLSQLLKKNRHFKAAEIRKLVMKTVAKFCEHNFLDDVTLLAISAD